VTTGEGVCVNDCVADSVNDWVQVTTGEAD